MLLFKDIYPRQLPTNYKLLKGWGHCRCCFAFPKALAQKILTLNPPWHGWEHSWKLLNRIFPNVQEFVPKQVETITLAS